MRLDSLRDSDFEVTTFESLRHELRLPWSLEDVGGAGFFDERLWSGVVAQFVSRTVDSGLVDLFVSAFNLDMRNRCCYVGLACRPEVSDEKALEGLSLLIDYAFACWDLRKVYAQTGRGVRDVRRVAQELGFVEEVKLARHDLIGNEATDRVIFGMLRREWADSQSSTQMAR